MRRAVQLLRDAQAVARGALEVPPALAARALCDSVSARRRGGDAIDATHSTPTQASSRSPTPSRRILWWIWAKTRSTIMGLTTRSAA